MNTRTWRAVLVTVLILVGTSTASRLSADSWRPVAAATRTGLQALGGAFDEAPDLTPLALAGALALWLGVRLVRRRPAPPSARPRPSRPAPAIAPAPRGRLAVRARETGHSQDALRLLAIRDSAAPADPGGRNCRVGSNDRATAAAGRPRPAAQVVAASAVATRRPAAARTAYRLPVDTSV